MRFVLLYLLLVYICNEKLFNIRTIRSMMTYACKFQVISLLSQDAKKTVAKIRSLWMIRVS